MEWGSRRSPKEVWLGEIRWLSARSSSLKENRFPYTVWLRCLVSDLFSMVARGEYISDELELD